MTSKHAQDLPTLFRAVLRARSEVNAARSGKSAPGIRAGVTEQQALLTALEMYTTALLLGGSPVPYRLHNELAMYRAMFDIRRPKGARPRHAPAASPSVTNGEAT